MVNDLLSNGSQAINFFTVKLPQLSGIALTTRTDVKVRVNPLADRDNFQSSGSAAFVHCCTQRGGFGE